MLTAVSFIFVLGVLIFIHELGHFLVAKKAGIRVEKFSLGFPPNIFKRTYGDTEYCIGMIPLGGYVKMAGENPDEEATGAPDEFMSKSVAARTAVILAGPVMNYVLTVVLCIVLFAAAGEPISDPDRSLVGEVRQDSPAAEAGLQTGDQIIAVDGQSVAGFSSLTEIVHPSADQPLTFSWLRGGDTVTALITPELSLQQNAEGKIDTVGLIGVSQQVIGYNKFSVFESMSLGFQKANSIGVITLGFLKQVIMQEVAFDNLGGPLFIAQQSGKEAAKGFASLLLFMAILSMNLAILNVLPIPVLDGGHLVFLLIEKIKGSPLSMKTRMMAMQVGMAALLLLIVSVTYNDIMRMFAN